jgi:MoxR-like ATPase
LALVRGARSVALLEGRDFVIPDDVKFLFLPVMRHRLVLAPAAEVEGRSTDEILEQIVEQVPAPR